MQSKLARFAGYPSRRQAERSRLGQDNLRQPPNHHKAGKRLLRQPENALADSRRLMHG